MRIGKTSPLFAKRADQGRDVKSGAGEREAPVAGMQGALKSPALDPLPVIPSGLSFGY
jgi:hypothetical protein